MSQVAFNFSLEAPLDAEDFIRSPANEEAARWLEVWPNAMPGGNSIATLPFSHAFMLCGASGSGKTHLATIWQKRVGALVVAPKDIYKVPAATLVAQSRYLIVEECQRIHDETAFFHFFNGVREAGGYVLFTSKKHPMDMRIRLSDLRSRLYAIPVVELHVPDEELVRSLVMKHFTDKQLRVDIEVVDFIAMRVDRSYEAVKAVVEQLDTAALHAQCAITIPFVRRVLYKK